LQHTSPENIQILHKQLPQQSSSSSRSHCPSSPPVLSFSTCPPVLASARRSQFDIPLNQLLHWLRLPSLTVKKQWHQHP
jgi:hypothetical protein